jgi:hypothetical protein
VVLLAQQVHTALHLPTSLISHLFIGNGEPFPLLVWLCDLRMETLAIIALVGNIVQFVDFTGKLILKSTELYQSGEGTFAENVDTETATNHLALLNNQLKDAAAITGDGTLASLCKSCGTAADELLATLDKVKVKQDKRKSIRKVLQSVWSNEKIEELERRLARFKEELNLHITVDLRFLRTILSVSFANYICSTGNKSLNLCEKS